MTIKSPLLRANRRLAILCKARLNYVAVIASGFAFAMTAAMFWLRSARNDNVLTAKLFFKKQCLPLQPKMSF
jgi:hypothetical protein